MRLLRWLGIIAGSLVGLVIVVLGVVYALSQRRISRQYDLAGHDVPLPIDSAGVAWGEHVAATRGCMNCHSATLGGATFIDVPPVVSTRRRRGPVRLTISAAPAAGKSALPAYNPRHPNPSPRRCGGG